MTEVDRAHDLFRAEIGQVPPQRFARAHRQEIPDRVDDGGQREVDDALFGAEPAELALAGERAPEGAEVGLDVVELHPDDAFAVGLDRAHADLVAAADREGEPVAAPVGDRPSR